MTKCILPYVGVFSSHRGTSLCCKSNKLPVGPLEFYNGETQQDVRRMMDNGQEHDLCGGCYHAERKGQISYRMFFNNTNKRWDGEALEYPQWLDLDWSNFCNLKCIMCGPDRSSTWAKETNDYADTNHIRRTSQKHIDDVYKLSSPNLRYLNLQGGEPSMMKEYDDYLQYLIDIDVAPNCEVTVVTNLTNINKQFYKKLGKFSLIKLALSMDAYGTNNDFVRYPSKFDIIDRNFKWIAETPFETAIQIAFQTTTMFDFDKFLVWLHDTQQYFKQHGKNLEVTLQQVNWPNELEYTNAPKKLKEKFIEDVNNYRKSDKRLSSAVRFEMEMLRITKQLSETAHSTDKPFVDYIRKIAVSRNLDISNYIPQFESIID